MIFSIKKQSFFLDMSTLITIETINPNLVIDNLHSSSQYYISVVICNHIDCGPSSSAINIQTPSSSDIPITIAHPINKPLLLNCPSTSSWLHRYFHFESFYSISNYILEKIRYINIFYRTILSLFHNRN